MKCFLMTQRRRSPLPTTLGHKLIFYFPISAERRKGKRRAKNRPRYRFAKRLTLFNLQVSLKIHELCCCLSKIICNSVTSSLPAGCKGGCRCHHHCSLLLRASERTRLGEENVIETRPSAAQCQINSYELISLFANALKLLTAG